MARKTKKKKAKRVKVRFRAGDPDYAPRPLSRKDQLLLDLRVERDEARAQLENLAGRLVAHGLHGQRTWDPVMANVIDDALRKVAAQKDATAHAAQVSSKTAESIAGIEKLLLHLVAKAERESDGNGVERLAQRLLRDEDD